MPPFITACGKDSALNEPRQEQPSVSTSPVIDRDQASRATTALQQQKDLSKYICPAIDPKCRLTGPLPASGSREALWLAQHGYPTNAERDRLNALSIADLETEASQGNRAAAVVKAKKLALEAGRFQEGTNLLFKQAQSGNLYAYYGLSEINWNSTTHRNLVDSAAYLRVAYLLGDYKASQSIASLGLSGAELVVADERAASLVNTLAGNAPPSPRPME